MGRLDKAILGLNSLSRARDVEAAFDPRCLTLVTILYLVALLSVPMTDIAKVIWMGTYPIVMSQYLAGGYWRLLRGSLFIIPFIMLIGVFNPVFDRVTVMTVGGVRISRGWVTFVSIILRGLWSVQAVMAMTRLIGFTGFCRGLRGLGVPSFLTNQLMMVYRYLIVLMEEAASMMRARECRGAARRSLPLRMWATMIGQLFIRTVDRAAKIHSAMLARGFTGEIPDRHSKRKWRMSDTVMLLLWSVAFALLRFVSPSIFLHCF